MKKNNLGFSMVELIVVIGIIAVISVIAVPILIERLPEYRLRSVTRDIVSCLQEAKMRAVTENSDTVIEFDDTNDQYTAWVDNGSGTDAGNRSLETASGEVVFKQVTLPSDIDIYQITGLLTNSIAVYNSRGLFATTTGSIWIRNNKSNYRKVVVSSAGNIRTEQSSDGATWN